MFVFCTRGIKGQMLGIFFFSKRPILPIPTRITRVTTTTLLFTTTLCLSPGLSMALRKRVQNSCPWGDQSAFLKFTTHDKRAIYFMTIFRFFGSDFL
jgi:hypothetical protein